MNVWNFRISIERRGVFNRLNADILRKVTPLFEDSIYRHNVEFENQINAHIQTEYTSLHTSVNWKFRENAIAFLTNGNDATKQKNQIFFENVFPMYGEIDVRNSSIIRNNCLKDDYQTQIHYLLEIC